MDNDIYLKAQQQFLNWMSAKLEKLQRHVDNPYGTANDYDFAFAELYSQLNDITEFSISTPGFTALTNLNPESLMGNLCMRTARAFRAPFAYLSFGGSSHSLLMMIGKILPGWLKDEKTSIILIDPLCHQSVLGGLDIGRWQAVKLHRQYYSELGVVAPLTLETIQVAVRKHGSHKISAIVYNPVSYDGFRNLKAEREIYAYCIANDIKVIGDFSWSPFFGFEGYGDVSGALTDYTNISICSPHKKNLFQSPVSILLYEDSSLTSEIIDAARLGWATTSPSFGTLMLVDYRLALIENGVIAKQLSKIVSTSDHLKQKINQINIPLNVVGPEDIGASYSDPAHLLLSSQNSGLDCRKLSQWLSQNVYLDLEKSTKQTALFLVSAAHQPKINQIVSALSEACSVLEINGDPS